MTQITANNIEIEYDTFGDPSGRPLLMIMGLGAQMTRWREELCQMLADEGHYVIRFDNRDIGLSQKFGHFGVPNIMRVFADSQAGKPVHAPYTLGDMAEDAEGLLNALHIDKAHVCGASMGGMIAQMMAVHHRERVLSLTSIMSTTGDPNLPKSTEEASAALTSPPGKDLDEVVERAVAVARAIGGKGFPIEAEAIKQRARADYERSFYPDGVSRQMAAIAATGNRRHQLEHLDLPTLVIHGSDDPLVPVEGGVDTHEAIKGSRLKVIDGMGHDLPEAAWPEIVEAITEHTTANHHD
ncbi:MAG: alpha/beta hydrolase [Gammaproteobacteria bacterium]|nr:alpha/beta hydrolase [Gammaproteobacteria bacterium]